MASPRAFLGAASAIQMLLLLVQILFIPSCLSLKLNTPSSNSEYVELVSGKSVQVTWTVESGDPSSFKLKLRNRNLDGRWTLSEDVETSKGQVVVTLPVVPNNINYYIEADVYDPDMRILSNTYPSPFTIMTADSAHLKNTPSSTQAQNTPTPAPTPTPTPTSTSTPNSTPSSTGKSPDETTASSTAMSITSVFSSTITRYSGTSVIGIIVETATTVLPQTFSSSPASASSQPTGVAPSNDGSSQKSSDKSNLGAILGGVLGGVCLLALALIVFLLHRRRKNRPSDLPPMSIEDGNESIAPFSDYQPTEVHYGKGPLTPITGAQGSEIPETSIRQQMDAMSQRIRQLEAQVTDPRESSETHESPPQYSEATVTPGQIGRRTKS